MCSNDYLYHFASYLQEKKIDNSHDSKRNSRRNCSFGTLIYSLENSSSATTIAIYTFLQALLNNDYVRSQHKSVMIGHMQIERFMLETVLCDIGGDS